MYIYTCVCIYIYIYIYICSGTGLLIAALVGGDADAVGPQVGFFWIVAGRINMFSMLFIVILSLLIGFSLQHLTTGPQLLDNTAFPCVRRLSG